MDGIRIRPPEPADFGAITEIANWAVRNTAATFKNEEDPPHVWEETWKTDKEAYPWHVAEREGRVVGFAAASEFKSR